MTKPGAHNSQLTVDLSGKVVLVTGASSGLGHHFSKVLAGCKATVALAARRPDLLGKLASEIERNAGRAVPIALDVMSDASIRSAVEETIGQLGGIDVVVNNAGITVSKPALEHTVADWDQILNTNLRGAFLVATEVARRMRDTKRPGSIINIASILGLRQASAVAAYAASKAGLVQVTKSLALELARYDIRVNAIAPGYIASDLNSEFLASEAGLRLIKRIPQRRLGELSDLDGPLLLLASDASKYMTGSVIAVDGGHLTSSL